MVSSTVSVRKGGYSVASETKNTGGTVKVQKGGYSVAQEKGTTTPTTYKPLSVSSGPKSTAQQESIARAAEQVEINKKVASLQAINANASAVQAAKIKAQNDTIRANQAKIDAQIAAAKNAQVVYPSIKVGSSIKSTAQTKPIVQTTQKTTTPKIAASQLGKLTEIKSSTPTPISQTYAKQISQNNIIKSNPVSSNKKSNFGIALAAENKPVISAKTLQGTYQNVGYVPSVLSSSGQKSYASSQLQKQYNQSVKNTSISDLDYFNQYRINIPSQIYPTYNMGKTPVETVKIAVKEGNVLDRINTGFAQRFDNAYNKIANSKSLDIANTAWKMGVGGTILPLGKIVTPKFVSNAGVGTVEGVVTFIPSTVTLGKGLVSNPVNTIKETASGTFNLAKTNPGRLTGNLIGSSIAGGAVSDVSVPVRGKIKNTINEKVPIPSIQSSYVTFVEKPGANALYARVKIGESVAVKGKPLYSSESTILKGAFKSFNEKVSGKPITGIKKGGLSAPSDLIYGKQMTAFGKLETDTFLNTVRKQSSDADIFVSGKQITDAVYNTKTPVFKPTEFKITAQDIPESARSFVEQSIKDYKGNIIVKGSESQKAQLKQYMTRLPGDIEIYVDNPMKYVNKKLEPSLKKAGVKYDISLGDEPKVHFISSTGERVKGIEIFKEGKKNAASTIPKKDTVGGYVTEYFQHPENIPFGYDVLSPVKTKVGNIKMLDLREQAARKFSGSTTFIDNQITVTHKGRVKDIRDLVDIGTGYALEKNMAIEPSIVQYATEQSMKFPKLLDEPLVGFIERKQRLPTKTEFNKIFDVKETQKVSNIMSLGSSKPFLTIESIKSGYNNIFSDIVRSETARVDLLGKSDYTKLSKTSDMFQFKSPYKINDNIFDSATKIIAENTDYLKQRKRMDYDTVYAKINENMNSVFSYPTIKINKSNVSPLRQSFTNPNYYPIPRTKVPTGIDLQFGIYNSPYPSIKPNIKAPSKNKTPYPKTYDNNNVDKSFKLSYPYLKVDKGDSKSSYPYPTIIPQVTYPIINIPPSYPTTGQPQSDYPGILYPPEYPTTSPLRTLPPTGIKSSFDMRLLIPNNQTTTLPRKKKGSETVKKPSRSKRYQWFIKNPIADVYYEAGFNKLKNSKSPW